MLQQRLSRSLQATLRQSSYLSRARTSQTPFAASTFRATPTSPIPTRQIAAQRWYSAATEASEKQEEKEVLGKDTEGPKETSKSGDGAKEENPLAKELEAKKKENVDVKDQLKRQVAEYRNLQEQTKREVQAARDFALQKFAKDLLESIDNLDRALENVPKEKLTSENQDLVNLHSGLKMTEEILMKTLKRHGMEKFDPSVEGEPFNPNQHEATFQAPQPDKKDGTVFFTQSKGFLYNGRVLRAAKVGVVKNS